MKERREEKTRARESPPGEEHAIHGSPTMSRRAVAGRHRAGNFSTQFCTWFMRRVLTTSTGVETTAEQRPAIPLACITRARARAKTITSHGVRTQQWCGVHMRGYQGCREMQPHVLRRTGATARTVMCVAGPSVMPMSVTSQCLAWSYVPSSAAFTRNVRATLGCTIPPSSRHQPRHHQPITPSPKTCVQRAGESE